MGVTGRAAVSLTTGAGGAATSECSWGFGGVATYGSPGGAATKLSGCCQCPMLSQKKGLVVQSLSIEEHGNHSALVLAELLAELVG